MNVTDNVEAYSGAAGLAMDLVRVPGRNGLDLSVSIEYSSRLYDGATRSNLTHPTGILGLGWSLTQEAIVAVADTAAADIFYYLIAGAASGRLVCVSTAPDGTQQYQGENFEFWQIEFSPALARWTVVREDGTTYVYGDQSSGRGTVQWSVVWGAWRGASVQPQGQTPCPVVFNLSEVSNRFGDSVTYSYDQVLQTVGTPSGPGTTAIYTQASYLSRVTGVTGDYVVLTYAEKENDATNQEYIDPHSTPPPPNAWQDRFETRYLASITLYGAGGASRFTQKFLYTTAGALTFLGSGVLAKRLLTAIVQTPADTPTTLPSPLFAYCGQSASDQVTVTNPFNSTTKCLYGAIKQITTPGGGTISYQYGAVSPVLSTRACAIIPPAVGATTFSKPRFKFEDGFTVATWLGSDATLKLKAYSWD